MILEISREELRSKIKGCWLGKNVGGTLGQPYEMLDGPFDLTFYDPVPTEMIPNDDLDLQLVWAVVLSKMEEVNVSRHVLAKAWEDHVGFPFDEYAVALKNLALGIRPPVSGSYDNWFKNSMGAIIRSEIWACLAPGKPEIAAQYAYEDACVDHDEDGLYAEVLMAALQSSAFVESDIRRLFHLSLDTVPKASRLHGAIVDTITWCDESDDWLAVRGKVLEKYGSENFSDVTMNACFIVLALLLGKGDFSDTICIAVNCGRDTDCTAATAGALMGIIDPGCIDEKWIKPIGDGILLSPEIVGIAAPNTIEDLTEMIMDIAARLDGKPPQVEETTSDTEKFAIPVERGFVERIYGMALAFDAPMPRMPGDSETIHVPGHWGTAHSDDFTDDVMLLKYKVRIRKPGRYNVMFNTEENCRVWIDGQYAFGRESGKMNPSPSRRVLNQFAELELEVGIHEIQASIQRPSTPRAIEWVVAVAVDRALLWVPDAFYLTK